MNNNYVFENVPDNMVLEIKDYLKKQGNSINQKQLPQGTIDCFSIEKNGEKITANHYSSKKFMLQGNPNSESFHNLSKELITKFNLNATTKMQSKIAVIDELKINREGFIGCDESGAGECFGSMFLGCAYIKKQELAYLKKFLGNKDIKRLDKSQVYNIFNDLEGKFSYNIKIISSNELDEHSKNVLLDKGYRELIESLPYDFSKQCIILDDYNTGIDLNTKLDELRELGSEIIVQHKADENYVCAMLASVVARRARFKHMEDLRNDNILIDPETGNKVFFESGSPSNPEVENYLKTFRKLYPHSDFPSFVRMKWKNIQELDFKYAKKRPSDIFTCPSCNGKTNTLRFYVGKRGEQSQLFCSLCNQVISPQDFQGILKKPNIVVDTSVILDRAISKDLSTSCYLRGSKILLISTLYEEVDRKRTDLKKGGQAEIKYIGDCSTTKIIEAEDVDLDFYKNVTNDKKFLYVLKRKNAILLTKDGNMSSFAQTGVLVLEIIQQKP
ncbi:MAG TPA: hypothetical protein VJJ53_01075 [Candidatus Nanoarchaeia archaeon]|nr:hypothetical protein [Candidatus Nanoarchaeia archaeon]